MSGKRPTYLPGDRGLGIVLAHGFTLNWQRPSVWRIARRLSRYGGVVTFDFRGHGRSGGLSTLGDREIRDVDVFSGPRLRVYLRRRARQRNAHPLSKSEIESIDKAAHVAFRRDPAS